jgi:hypothetical protein
VWYPSYGLLKIKQNALTQDVARLNGDYMTYWKIPGHKNHLISIWYLLLQVLDVVDFCALNSKI